MNAITISQPYASLIADGQKFVENRTWPAPVKAIGQDIAIHAGKGVQYLTRKQLTEYPNGCVIAIATLALCVSKQFILERTARNPNELAYSTRKTWQELFSHIHTEGPFCWILTNVRKLKHPIPASGNMGLWPFTDPCESPPDDPSKPCSS